MVRLNFLYNFVKRRPKIPLVTDFVRSNCEYYTASVTFLLSNCEYYTASVTFLGSNCEYYTASVTFLESNCEYYTASVTFFRSNCDYYTASANALLLPVCTLHGAAVTTIEGLGSTTTTLHLLQERLAKAHGSQVRSG